MKDTDNEKGQPPFRIGRIHLTWSLGVVGSSFILAYVWHNHGFWDCLLFAGFFMVIGAAVLAITHIG